MALAVVVLVRSCVRHCGAVRLEPALQLCSSPCTHKHAADRRILDFRPETCYNVGTVCTYISQIVENHLTTSPVPGMKRNADATGGLMLTDESRPSGGFIPAEILVLFNGTAGDHGTAGGTLNQPVLGFLVG